MSGHVDSTVLQRMVVARAASPTEVPVTASRAMRLAISRAAERTVGLQLSVMGVEEEVLSLEGVQKALPDDWLLLKLSDESGVVGVVALDRACVAAIVEVRTTGTIAAISPDLRAVTVADLALSQPLLDGFFVDLLETTKNTALDGWTEGVSYGTRFENGRAIGLALAHVTYRLIRITLELGGTDRQGELILSLPATEVEQPENTTPVKNANWASDMRETILDSPAALTAVLHRFELPLCVANTLKVDQVLALPGCTVSSVQMVGPDGGRVARAKLGQVAGHVAVRLEDPIMMPMQDLAAPDRVAATDEQLVLTAKAD